MSSVIEITNLKKKFKQKQILRNINLTVEKGRSLVIIGGSGSGKSVIIRSILGLITPDSGSIKINNIETVNASKQKRQRINEQFGMLFQNAALFDSLPVWHNITFAARKQRNLSYQQARDFATENLKVVGLTHTILDELPGTLSIGTQKRIGLARAIATRPSIVLFDEPTTGLDPIMTDVINQLIYDCVKEYNMTSITITHDISTVNAIADKIAFLYQGNIEWSGTKKDLEKSKNELLHQFINGLAEGPLNL